MSARTQRRSCYINFASHLLNAYNPNVLYPDLPHVWSDDDWRRFIDMIAAFGFNCFEFWLVPRLFSREGLDAPFGRRFAEQMRKVIDHARTRGVETKMFAALTTVGTDWHAHCPNVPAEWSECRMLWDEWTRRLPGLGVVGLFPGDPGGCSRNGCTARTFIDKSAEIAGLVRGNQPGVEIELNTWGNPFFAWGCIEGPPGWSGEFVQEYQHTAWKFDKARADDAMRHLLRRLGDFPDETTVAINLAFNPNGEVDTGDGDQDARHWAREIARTNRIVTWDFSLTEGENSTFPHYRFDRLFAQRRREREAAPYSGGICFTMTPKLNQLSLYQSAHSFLDPDGDPDALTRGFYRDLFAPGAERLAELLPLFEVVPDWGNRSRADAPPEGMHAKMTEGAELLRSLEGRCNRQAAFFPDVEQYRAELEWFFDLFAELSGPSPDFGALGERYYQHVYGIYDRLPVHVDPRPRRATEKILRFFRGDRPTGPAAGEWVNTQ